MVLLSATSPSHKERDDDSHLLSQQQQQQQHYDEDSHTNDHKEPHPSSAHSSAKHSLADPLCTEELKYEHFLQWLHAGGAKFPNLVLRRYAKDYRGVHIQSGGQEVPKGKCLLKIPHSLLITVELAKQSPLGATVATLPNIGSQAILALYLIQERAKAHHSFWHPWLAVLPSSFNNLPMFFSMTEMLELQGSSDLLLKIKSQQKSMRDEFNSIVKCIRARGIEPTFDFDQFVWAALAVGTRVFSLCINNVKTSVLAPLADMMNHRNPSPASWTYDNKKQAFTLTCITPMLDGEAVYESYGVKDNKRFFASYGFCLMDNPANEVSVSIKSDISSDSGSGSSVNVRTFNIRQCYDAAFEDMLGYLRMINAFDSSTSINTNVSVCDSSSVGFPPRLSFSKPLSIDNELSSLYALRCTVKEQLRLYPSTLAMDEELFLSLTNSGNDSDSVNNLRNILVFRMGEKRIYHWLAEFATAAIALLCASWEEAREKIRLVMDLASTNSGASVSETESLHLSMIGYISGVVAPLLSDRHRVTTASTNNRSMVVMSEGELASARRLSQDLDRKLLVGLSLSNDDRYDGSDANDTSDTSDNDSDNGNDGDDQHTRKKHHQPSHSQSSLSQSGSKRSSLTNPLPPVSLIKSQAQAQSGTKYQSASSQSSSSPYSRPSVSQPRVSTTRAAAPPRLPTMQPIQSRSSSHAPPSSSSSTTSVNITKSVTKSPATLTAIAPRASAKLPSVAAPLPHPAHSPLLPGLKSSFANTPATKSKPISVRGSKRASIPSPAPSTSSDLSDGDDCTPQSGYDDNEDDETTATANSQCHHYVPQA